MSAYLYPEMKSKVAYKRAIAEGVEIKAYEMYPWGKKRLFNEVTVFEGPHYPKPHKYYGKAVVKNGLVIKIT